MNMTEQKPEFCICSAVEIGGRNFEPLQDQLVSPQEASLTTSSLQHLGTQPGFEKVNFFDLQRSLPSHNSESENFFVPQPKPF